MSVTASPTVSSTIGLAVLGFANYATHENAVAVAQTFTAKNALLSCMTLIPMGGYILMLLPILFYSISRKQHTQMMAEIAARKAAKHE